MSPTNITTMNTWLTERCSMVGLSMDCGCGGLFNATIAFVAEAPGDREVEQRVPLVGGSGRVLWDSLRRENIQRNQVYITNVVKRRLLTAAESYGKSKSAIGNGELDHWSAILHQELSLLPHVRYVVALGNYALKALTGEGGITQRRGNVVDVSINGKLLTVIAAYNPAHVLREPKTEVTFRMDLHKITRVVEGRYAPPSFNELINPTATEALEYIEFVRRSRLPTAFDIEIMANETACVGLANSNTEGMCINFRTQAHNRYDLVEERDIRLALQNLFSDRSVEFIAQNGSFDSYWLWFKDRLQVHKVWFDTMLAHHCLYPPLPHNLGYISSQYTDVPYYKDDLSQWRETGDIDTFWRYNVKDCIVTRMAALRMHGELKEAKLNHFFFDHVMRLQPHLVRMTIGGVKCDASLKAQFAEELGASLGEQRSRFVAACRDATGDDSYECNPLSTRDLGKLFFTDLRLVGRGTSTDDENRDRMLRHPKTSELARTAIIELNHYKKDHKFFSTYVSAEIDEDGRFRCEYKQTGVQSAPGRLSSAGVMWGTGTNLQNIPERAKGMMVCDEGYEFNYFDASQIEARIVGRLAKITRWNEQFELARQNPGSYDAHCALAADMFKVPYEQVPRDDHGPDGKHTIRYIAKRCRHGLNYRMGPDRLATVAGLTVREAETAYAIYHRETPELRVWWDSLISEVRRTRMLVSPLGRRWLLLERFDDNALESIVAFKPQSTAGDKVASVIYLCESDPEWPRDARMCMNVHDALIWICRPEHGDLTRRIAKKYMEQPVIIDGEPLIIPAEFKVSRPDNSGVHRWSTLAKVKMAA